jgi:bile acid-coenzyme A ligase
MLALASIPGHHPPERLALVHENERWTFGDLDARSALWASWLKAQGVRPDDLVSFAWPNGPDFIALAFGIYRAGATPAPLSPSAPEVETRAILAVMRPALHVLVGQEPGAETAPGPATHVAASWKACTSGGSTGQPKVIVDARPAGFPAGTDFIGIPEEKPVLVPGPLYHNAPFSAAVFALWRGCTVVSMDRFDAESSLGLIMREKIAWSIMVPTMLHRIWRLDPPIRDRFDLSAWTMVVHTAAPMADWLKRAWIGWRGADHIYEVYGATEGLVRCWIGGIEWLAHPGSVGRPLGGAKLRILSETGEEQPTGATGEVYAMPASGPGTTYRYIGAERRATHDGWESVGDSGYVDGDGYLFLTDRKNDMIISGGVNIWPAEVEAALLRHADVRSCAVYGAPDVDLGQIVHAVIETSEPLSLEGVRAFLRSYLAHAKLPRSISIQAEPVRSDAGKFRKPIKDSR